MNTKNINALDAKQYKRSFTIFLFIVPALISLHSFPQDDGLRHVGLAFANLTSWADVYPYSTFESLRDYDPWYGYDLSLKTIARIFKLLPYSTLTLSFILVKLITFLFIFIFLRLIVARSDIDNKIEDLNTLILAIVIITVFLALPIVRLLTIRPFIFGTLFLIYSIGRKGIANGVFSSSVLTFFYPYLSWFYILPVAFTHFVKGDKRYALGAMSFIIVFLFLQPSSFWSFQVALVNSDSVRNAMASKIGEFTLTLKTIIPYFYVVGFLLLYPKIFRKEASLNYTTILIIVYFAPSLKYIRYFSDLILPLIFVSLGKELLIQLVDPYQKLMNLWQNIIKNYLNALRKIFKLDWRWPSAFRTNDNSASTTSETSLKPYIAIAYSILFAVLIFNNIKDINSLRSFKQGLSTIPTSSLILTSFNLQYKTLFVRPDLSIVPSCEIAFADQYITKEYLEFFDKGIVIPLSRKIGVKFLLEDRNKYIDPQQGKLLRLNTTNEAYTLWDILDQEGS